jgi:hypothetical protein
LRSRKAEIDRTIESQRAAARFEPDATIPMDPNAIRTAEAKAAATGTSTPTIAKPAVDSEPEEDAYTSRLLKAKKQVWRDRGFNPEKGNE